MFRPNRPTRQNRRADDANLLWRIIVCVCVWSCSVVWPPHPAYLATMMLMYCARSLTTPAERDSQRADLPTVRAIKAANAVNPRRHHTPRHFIEPGRIMCNVRRAQRSA